MSSTIWTQCGGISNLRPLTAKPWRVVEAQHIVSTMKLVDSVEEQRILEELIETSKPPLPREDTRIAKLDFLLFTPFRYPPLPHGSRFGTRAEPGIWYGSSSLRSVFAEKAYYRFVFLAGTRARLAPLTTEQTSFRAEVGSRKGVDLTRVPFDRYRDQISSKTTYDASQELGRAMREAGAEAFRYTSARDIEGGANLGLFSPNAFAKNKPHSFQTWLCLWDERKVQFTQKNFSQLSRISFSLDRAEFEVNGKIPAPAL